MASCITEQCAIVKYNIKYESVEQVQRNDVPRRRTTVRLFLYTSLRYVYGGVDVKLYSFLTSALGGREWSASGNGRFTPKNNPLTPWTGEWVGPRAGVDVFGEEKDVHVDVSALLPLHTHTQTTHKYTQHEHKRTHTHTQHKHTHTALCRQCFPVASLTDYSSFGICIRFKSSWTLSVSTHGGNYPG